MADSNKIQSVTMLSESITEQIKELAALEGVNESEMRRWLILLGLRSRQAALIAAGRLPAED